MSDVIVGIDLGTTNSLVAVCDKRGPRVLVDPRLGPLSGPLLPSVVRFCEHDGSVESVGDDALQRLVEHSSRTVSGAKRAMGRGFAEVDGQLRGAGRVEADARGRPVYAIGAQRLAPERVSAAILRELRDRANAALEAEHGPDACRRAVITVPAYFDDAQRQATRDAARLAGVEPVRIINEPTAAALAYGIGRAGGAPETIAVFDLGGGTFDISILEVTPPPQQGSESKEQDAGLFRVLATAGDTALGGDDLDASIAEALFPELWGKGDAQERLELIEACRHAKCELSDRAQTSIRVAGTRRTMDQATLREIAQPWVARALRACERAWSDAGRVAIDRLLMVGGSTRSPFVREAAGAFFGVEPCTALDPDEVVALGASVQATVLAGARTDLLLLDVVPLSLGIETVGGAVAKLIMRNSTIPTHATEMFSTSVDGQRRVAIHILQGERELVADCRSLARCELAIPPMPAGIPQVEVMFTIDASGLLRVTARERRTGASVQVQVIPTYGLSADEVEEMEREAWSNARVDMHRHRVIDLVAHASLDLAWVDGAVRRAGDALAAEARAPLTAAAASLRSLVDVARRDPDGVDADEFQRAKEALDRASVPVHEASITRALHEMERVDGTQAP